MEVNGRTYCPQDIAELEAENARLKQTVMEYDMMYDEILRTLGAKE